MPYWTVGTGPRVGAVLAQYVPSPKTKCRLTTDFGVMPVLNQYIFQCQHGTDVQYYASTDGQIPAKLPFGAAPVIDRAQASTMPVPHQYRKSFSGTGAVLAQCWRKHGLPPARLRKITWLVFKFPSGVLQHPRKTHFTFLNLSWKVLQLKIMI